MSWDWNELKKQHEEKNKPLEIKEKKPIEVPAWVWSIGYGIFILFLMVAMFFPLRWLHYKFSYENKVQQQIIEMVNPEALKEEYRKQMQWK